MRRSNPNPVLLTSKSFTSSGAGVPCYAFSFENQRVIKSCYTRYNVALRFSCLNSICYRRVLQNGISRAYMCGCRQVRAYTRASVRVHSCYIATSRLKSLKKNRKSVAGPCSRCVVCPCYGEKNKIFGVYSEGTDGAGRTAKRTVEMAGSVGRNGAGCSGRNAVAGHSEKWQISAVFGKAFNAAFNVRASNVIQKAQFSAVFRAVGTFFLKMCAVGRVVRPARSGCPGGSPQRGRFKTDMSGPDFFSIFGPHRLLAGLAGGSIFHGCSGNEGFRE